MEIVIGFDSDPFPNAFIPWITIFTTVTLEVDWVQVGKNSFIE